MGSPGLTPEEKELLDEFDSGTFESALNPSRKRALQQTAANTFKKDKRINIRISSRDLEALQRKAVQEGIPYQTLVSSVLHKFVSGSLLDVTANK